MSVKKFFCRKLNLFSISGRNESRKHVCASKTNHLKRVKHVTNFISTIAVAVLPALLIFSGQTINAQECPHAKAAMAGKQCPARNN